ncbi:glycosyl hydrolase [Streptomyces sp. OE57]|uniref:glycosyl hydrolase n=1 Tax=Streptomyces lacaronensis TaxID=3379885 RepID=UPI0039B77C86
MTAASAAVFQGSSGKDRDQVTGVAAAGDAEHTVTVRNETSSRIWVGAGVNADGSAPLTGLPTLDPGKSATIKIPERSDAGHWRGKLFPRQGCSGKSGSTFHCEVGDCGPYADRCSTGEQPVSLAEFNFDTRDKSAPWYNVSYVNAVSTPITISPDGAKPPENGGECSDVGCPTDLLAVCPPENLTKAQGTGKPLVCVNPNRDAKTAYSDALTQKCPTAYAWSKHDAEGGNQVVRQCSKCSGLTVTFHGDGASEKPKPKSDPKPKPKPGHGDKPDPGRNRALVPGKGVGVNAADGSAQALKDSGVSWYHNWTSSTGKVAKPKGVEFVPTIWGPGSVNDAELGKAAKEGKNLLTFNEPDLSSQANMSVEQALDLWPRLEKTGLKLGAPAVAANADKPGAWLDQFMKGAAKRHLRVDFIPVHWYGSDFSSAASYQLADYLERIHDRYKKPIWLTEYALKDFSKQGASRYPSEKEQTRFIKWSTDALGVLPYVKRYAWFALSKTKSNSTGLYDGTTPNASGNTYRDVG